MTPSVKYYCLVKLFSGREIAVKVEVKSGLQQGELIEEIWNRAKEQLELQGVKGDSVSKWNII